MGAFSATFSLALIVGPWAGAALLDHFGGPVIWTSALVCGLASAALVTFARSRPVSVVAPS